MKLASARNARGFSLVELAIVMLVVGLVIGGLLLGRALITQSEVKAVVGNFNGLTAAYFAYRDRYAAEPGDDAKASGRWANGSARDGNGDGRISGNYDETAPTSANLGSFTIDGTAGESLNFWWHLRLAGLVREPPGAASIASQPKNGFAGLIGVQTGGAGLQGLTMCQANLPGNVAEAVEGQLDDMKPSTGHFRGLLQTQNPQSLATATPVTFYEGRSDVAYVVCRTP